MAKSMLDLKNDGKIVTSLASTDLILVMRNPDTTPEDDVITAGNFNAFNTRFYHLLAFDYAVNVSTGDGAAYIHIPADFNNWNLTYIRGRVITAGTTNSTTVQVYNVTDSVDMLDGAITIASGATLDDGTTGSIDVDYDDVQTDDLLRIDVDAVSTTPPKGLIVILGFTKP